MSAHTMTDRATPLLGCIADDFTGGTDLANALVRHGMRVVQTIGTPKADAQLDADAIVVSLKCRSIEPDEAVAQCLDAVKALQAHGCTRFFWKYCSTFDSTPRGNIGPVAKALLEHLAADGKGDKGAAPLTLFCPAFPENKRTVYKGRLFVGDVPLDESPMRHHPLTPMTDSSLVRLLAPQVGGMPEAVACVNWDTVRQGAEAVRTALRELAHKGVRYVVADAIVDEDLFVLGEACADMPLVTGGSGIAIGLPAAWRKAGLLPERGHSACALDVPGHTALLAGSCSEATRGQLAKWMARGLPERRVEALRLAEGPKYLEELIAWAKTHAGKTPLLHASATPREVQEVQEVLGRDRAGELVEHALSTLAVALRDAGVTRFVVAGGETSGAVVKALHVDALGIGEQIAPGVPWTVSTGGGKKLVLALKSGNFGGPDFFGDAISYLPK